MKAIDLIYKIMVSNSGQKPTVTSIFEGVYVHMS
ncbi:hypothetical protein DUGA6_41540 [Duganella sp. HH105]|nr:hypothetical protein DUGA6_41540 [Duganella sp. HH105]